MAVSVQMPKQGNTVEECLLVEWKVKEGDAVKQGDVLCSIETDKASFDVESTAEGVILRLLAKPGDLVPVLSDIAIVGKPGEDAGAAATAPQAEKAPVKAEEKVPAAAPKAPTPAPTTPAAAAKSGAQSPVSPRAKKLAEKYGIDAGGVAGTGINNRVTSRDIQALADSGALPRPTPLAKQVMAETGKIAAGAGSGLGGMVRARDLVAGGARSERPALPDAAPEAVPFKGIRKLIGDRMLQSLANHAQLTLNSSADATNLLALRKTIKDNAEAYGLPKITVNDLICWVVAQTLPFFPEVNAVFDRAGAVVNKYTQAHLGVAVDTPRGLMVPVVADAHRLSLAELSRTIAKYAEESRKGSILPDLLSGGTFTVTNLGTLGVETFTPVLNSPQVAILGVCAVTETPVRKGDGFVFQPRMGLSLTIDHQVVDGAPGARFLQAVVKGIENVQSSLAMLGAL